MNQNVLRSIACIVFFSQIVCPGFKKPPAEITDWQVNNVYAKIIKHKQHFGMPNNLRGRNNPLYDVCRKELGYTQDQAANQSARIKELAHKVELLILKTNVQNNNE